MHTPSPKSRRELKHALAEAAYAFILDELREAGEAKKVVIGPDVAGTLRAGTHEGLSLLGAEDSPRLMGRSDLPVEIDPAAEPYAVVIVG